MKIEQSKVTPFTPITITLETKDDLDLMISNMGRSYMSFDSGSREETFAYQLEEDLKDIRRNLED